MWAFQVLDFWGLLLGRLQCFCSFPLLVGIYRHLTALLVSYSALGTMQPKNTCAISININQILFFQSLVNRSNTLIRISAIRLELEVKKHAYKSNKSAQAGKQNLPPVDDPNLYPKRCKTMFSRFRQLPTETRLQSGRVHLSATT